MTASHASLRPTPHERALHLAPIPHTSSSRYLTVGCIQSLMFLKCPPLHRSNVCIALVFTYWCLTFLSRPWSYYPVGSCMYSLTDSSSGCFIVLFERILCPVRSLLAPAFVSASEQPQPTTECMHRCGKRVAYCAKAHGQTRSAHGETRVETCLTQHALQKAPRLLNTRAWTHTHTDTHFSLVVFTCEQMWCPRE